MRRLSFFTVQLALLLSISSVGAAQGEASAISLKEAIAIALERNIGVIQAENALEVQQSNRVSAYGDLFPSLSASGSWTRSQIDRLGTTSQSFGGATFTIPASFSVTNNFSSSINLSYTLFNGFANTANLNRATSSVRAAEHGLSRTRQQTIYETTQLYLNVLRTRELVKVREENLKRSLKQLERITEANRVGALSLADVYRQQVQVGSDELALIQAQNDYDNAKADLAFYLALNVLQEYDFSDPTIPSDIEGTEIKDVAEKWRNIDAIAAAAMEARPDYQSAVASYHAAGSAVSAAQAGHFPTISLFASHGYFANQLSLLRDNRSTSWGLQVSLPIFSGFRVDNQVQQARVSERNALEQLKQTERKLKVDIRKALLDLEAAEKQVDVTRKSVISAEQDHRIAEEKYNLGAGTLLDLLIANANYVSAVSNKVNAIYNYNLVKKQFEFVTGVIQY